MFEKHSHLESFSQVKFWSQISNHSSWGPPRRQTHCQSPIALAFLLQCQSRSLFLWFERQMELVDNWIYSPHCATNIYLNIRLACSTGRLRTKNPFKVANFTLTSVQGTQRVESTLFKLLLSFSPFHWVCISAPRFNYAYSH